MTANDRCRMMSVECQDNAAIVRDKRPVPHSSFLIPHFLALLLLTSAIPALAADAPQQLWVVSTRNAPNCGDLDATLQSLRYCRMNDDCQWSSADAESFSATDDLAVPTVVFIHGNRTDADDAVWKACYTYGVIRAESAGRPFRYVIWSWPAERVYRNNRDDVRLKAAYSDTQSYYLAQWLHRLRPGVRVSLIGHSFGPRIITGAMHLLGGGEVAGRSLSQSSVAEWTAGKRNKVRAVMLAAAIDADWLAPGGCHGLALPLIDEMLITRNGCDRVLRWYSRLYDHGRPQAMGLIGPCGVADIEKVEVVDVSCTVGKRHDWRYYCSALNVCDHWAHYTFLDDTPAQP